MKILFISKYAATPDSGNPSRQFFFARQLAENGHEVVLVNSRSNGVCKKVKWGNGKKVKGAPCHPGLDPGPDGNGKLLVKTFPGPIISLGMNLKRMWTWVLFELQLLWWFPNRRIYRKGLRGANGGWKPDIVLVSSLSFFSFLNGVRLKRKRKIHLAIEIRDLYPLTLIEVGGMSRWNPIVLLMGWIERRAYKKADLIISSLEQAEVHIKNVGARSSRSFLWLPMGFPEQVRDENGQLSDVGFPEIPQVPDQVWDDGGGERAFVVGYAGTLGTANAMEDILEVMGDAEVQERNIHLVCYGGGPLREEFERRYAGEHVHFYDAVPKVELPGVLKKCEVLFNAWLDRPIYRFGISPNKWIDYMSAGRPILLALNSKSGIFEEAKCGWQIEAENREVLKNKLLELAEMDQKTIDQLGENGRKYLINHLTYSHLTQRLEEELEKTIDLFNYDR